MKTKTKTKIIYKDELRLTAHALECVEETGIDPLDDALRLLAGEVTREQLLAECLDGADEDRWDGWHNYVDDLVLWVDSRPTHALVSDVTPHRATIEAFGSSEEDVRRIAEDPDVGLGACRVMPLAPSGRLACRWNERVWHNGREITGV